jgi:ribonuclease Z
MNFSVTILGSSSASPTVSRFPSSQMVQLHGHHYLVDCGEGAQLQLRRFGLPLYTISGIFISHLHGDHWFGLFGLLSSLDLMGRTKPLPIFAPCGMRDIIATHLVHIGFELKFTPQVHELEGEQERCLVNAPSFTVSAFPLSHRVPTYGFLFREKEPRLNIRKESIALYGLTPHDIVAIKGGADFVQPNGDTIPNAQLAYRPHAPRAYAYCSDTMPHPTVVRAVRSVDLLYHEATYDEQLSAVALQRGHSTALQAAQTARDAQVGMLIIGHFSARYHHLDMLLREAQQTFPNTILADEGATIAVGSTPQIPASAGLTFRNATADDLPRMVEIYNSTIAARTATADLQPVSVAERMSWFRAHNPQQHPLLVIELPNKIVAGWVSLQPYHHRAAYESTQEVSLYIDQSCRKKGIGQLALRHIMQLAKSVGTKDVVALIFEHNEPSMKLFFRYGFVQWGRLPNVATLDGLERTLCILGKRT